MVICLCFFMRGEPDYTISLYPNLLENKCISKNPL